MNLDSYDYLLPEKNLALSPAVPRDSSKLFVYNTATDEIIFDYFYNIDRYLPSNSFMVLNNTKVLPARVTMKKESGGKVILLFLVNELTHRPGSGRAGSRVVKALVDRKINIDDLIYFDPQNYLKVIRQNENIFELEFNFSQKHLFKLLNQYGTMPIPPYLKKSPLKRDELLEKYQTIFARAPAGARLASTAAPTASLHFTDSVFNRLKKKGIEKYFITLHVGLGTFAPITNKNIKEKKLHEEYYEVDKEILQCIDTLKSKGKKLVAVGTTVARTLESVARQHVFSTASPQRGPRRLSQKQLSSLSKSRIQNLESNIYRKTDLFILPPYNFKMADIMITNFHLPKSSLMMLVEAFLQFKGTKKSLVELYNIAIKNNFSFYSFGDAMLIL